MGSALVTVAPAPDHGVEVGCVLRGEVGVLLVLTDHGPLRASYGATLLRALALDRSGLPQAGEWVTLRRWRDGPVTVEGRLLPPAGGPLAPVLPLRRPRRPARRG